jgi:hypothetical protein
VLSGLQISARSRGVEVPVFGMIMEENSTPLRICWSDLKAQFPTLLDDHIRGPDLNVDRVNFPRFDGLNIRRKISTDGLVGDGVCGIDFAEGDAEPALCHGDGVSCRAGVENLDVSSGC